MYVGIIDWSSIVSRVWWHPKYATLFIFELLSQRRYAFGSVFYILRHFRNTPKHPTPVVQRHAFNWPETLGTDRRSQALSVSHH
jgi:hypothetical protein